MRAVIAPLETAHNDGALGEVKIVPTKVAGLAHAQAMTVDHEADQPIAIAVPIALEHRQQLVHLGFGQVLAHAIGRVWLARKMSSM